MGCDIHCHIELKINDEWHHYSHPKVDRDYGFFHKIAGVRHPWETDKDTTPLAVRRGIPADATFMTTFSFDVDGGHSPTWLNVDEISALNDWLRDNRTYDGQTAHIVDKIGYLLGNSPHGIDWLRPDGVQDVRLICWFDC